jgi:hypothetical protein
MTIGRSFTPIGGIEIVEGGFDATVTWYMGNICNCIYSDVRGNSMNRPTRQLSLMILTLSLFYCNPVDKKEDNAIFAEHPISFYLTHDNIPQFCKDLFSNIRQPTDDTETLALLDSLLTTNSETEPFYFLTITRTIEKADGAYSESLGLIGKQYLEKRTKEFVKYFIDEPLLTDKDFENWAKIVAGEIQISAEGQEKEELERLQNGLISNCNTCTAGQIKMVENFVDRVSYYCP